LKDLVIYGSGGHAREVRQLVEDLNEQRRAWNLLGFLDDDPSRWGLELHGLPVLGGLDWLTCRPSVAVAAGVGVPAARRLIVRRVMNLGAREFPVLVHPRAWLGRHVSLGEGTIIFAGCLLTTDVVVGRHCVMNLGCTVSHDARIADYVTLAPRTSVCGRASIGEGCDLGVGCSVIQGVTVGAWTIVGAGAAVVRDLPPNVTAVGVPARPIRAREDGWHEAGIQDDSS